MMTWLALIIIFLMCPFNSIDASPNLIINRPKLGFHNSAILSVDDGKSSSKQSPKPTNTLFQVTKPIDVPNTVPCKQLLLQHEFSSTDGKPHQVVTSYTGPPSNCIGSNHQGFAKIVLESSGTFKGTQDDSVFGVWLGGVELLRSSPAQGWSNTSSAWAARKDITRYSSLLLKKQKQKLVVFFRTASFGGKENNVGVYHLKISISFYPDEQKSSTAAVGRDPNFTVLDSGFRSDSKADLILPISQNPESRDGLWFEIENSTDAKLAEFEIPRNAYRVVLEVYVSAHHYDHKWYSNYLPEFYNSNQFLDVFENGPFRDVVITLDDVVAGAIWPYPVIYSAGNGMWNPVASIRSFDLPSYDIELTPFLGTLLDGGSHNLSFGIGNTINVWYIDANLHLWLDHKSNRTEGKLVSNHSQPLDLSSTIKMEGRLGKSWVEAHRIVTSRGWVQSSHGNITTHVSQDLSYTNFMDTQMEGDYSATTKQLIVSNDTVSFATNSNLYSFESRKTFSLMEKDETIETEDGWNDDVITMNVHIGYSDDKTMTYEDSDSRSSTMTSSLRDQQSGKSVRILKNNTWMDALQGMNQSYHYQNVDDENKIKVCYLRSISTLNATIVYDNEDGKC